MTTFSWSMSAYWLHLPTAMATRPQFGSAPCTAVFTSGEFTMAFATVFACPASRAPSTVTSMSVSAPSPSRAICFVRLSSTSWSAVSNAFASASPAAPLARITAVSLVLVSVSTETQFSVRFTTSRNTESSDGASIAASVNTIAIIVAMSGSIMPTPFATPTMRAPDPATVASWILCTVSVVMMPRATSSASWWGSGTGRRSMPARMRSIGYWRPITPVDAMSISFEVMPSFSATLPAISTAFCMPSSPVATFAFFDSTTIARFAPFR